MATNLPTGKDEPVRADSSTKYDSAWYDRVEERFDKVGGELVEQRNRSFSCIYPRAGESAIARRTVVALSVTGAADDPVMVPATLANLAAGAIYAGVLTETTPPGQRGRVATGGLLPPSLTGLSSAGYARPNDMTGAIEVVATPTGLIVGRTRADGVLVLGDGGRAISTIKTITLPSVGTEYSITIDDIADTIVLTGGPDTYEDLFHLDGSGYTFDVGDRVRTDFGVYECTVAGTNGDVPTGTGHVVDELPGMEWDFIARVSDDNMVVTLPSSPSLVGTRAWLHPRCSQQVYLEAVHASKRLAFAKDAMWVLTCIAPGSWVPSQIPTPIPIGSGPIG